MNNYKIYIWLLDKDSKTQLIETETAMKLAWQLVVKQFGFWTIYTWNWIYTHDDWTIVNEPTIIIETSTDEHWLNEFIQTIWKQLNQESIFYKVENAWTCVFIK